MDFIKKLAITFLDVRSTKIININRNIISLVINKEFFYLRINSIFSYSYNFFVTP